jgi:aspartyl-tRNA(Asn)/glutamyl-tRNA(Gln) amidotransferase subunit A
MEKLSISRAHQLLKNKEVSSVELTQAYLEKIESLEPSIKAFVTITPEVALKQAARADEMIARGDIKPLTGIPVAIKDLISTKGIRTTCSSKMLFNYIPPYDATVMERLYGSGAVVVGKTNMDEFAMGSSTENSAFFTTHNPYDLERVPGGSSGGSAAAVAAGEAVYALGSDTGGSIRQPASFCGVVGLKPTYGRVSRYGLVAFASSLDQIGPMTQDTLDAALVMNAIAGYDERDATSVPEPVPDYTSLIGKDIKGMRIGAPKEYFERGIESGVERLVRKAISKLEQLGAVVDWDASLPHTDCALACYYIIAPSEASANLSRYDGVKYGLSVRVGENALEDMALTRQAGFGDEVKRRIMLGTYALSAGYYDAWYLKAQKVRTIIRHEFDEAFKKYDVLVTPTSPTVAFKIGEKASDPYQMYLSDIYTLPVNIAGLPAISIPVGLEKGLPVGLQVIGKPFNEGTVLKVASACETKN